MLFRALEVRSRPLVTCGGLQIRTRRNTDLWIRSVLQQIARSQQPLQQLLKQLLQQPLTNCLQHGPAGSPTIWPGGGDASREPLPHAGGLSASAHAQDTPLPARGPSGQRPGRAFLVAGIEPAQRSGLDRRRPSPSDRSQSALPDLSAAEGRSPSTAGRPRTCRPPQAETRRCGTAGHPLRRVSGRPYVGSRASRTAGLR